MKVIKKEILIGAGILGSVGSAIVGIYALLDKESDTHITEKKHNNSKLGLLIQEPIYDDECFDINGFNKKCYDRNGYDLNGFDKNGFDSKGYNKTGFNRLGFNRNGYNILGLDICGKSSKSYEEVISILEKEKEVAFDNLNNDQLDFAQFKARTIIEDAITLLIKHYCGESSCYLNSKLQKKINILKQLNKDIDSYFINRCHQVRKICNLVMYIVLEPSVTHNQAHFAVMQAKETIQLLKNVIGGQVND